MQPLSSLLLTTSLTPGAPAAPPGERAPGFSAALAKLMVPPGPEAAATRVPEGSLPATIRATSAPRQADAVPGKDLPVATLPAPDDIATTRAPGHEGAEPGTASRNGARGDADIDTGTGTDADADDHAALAWLPFAPPAASPPAAHPTGSEPASGTTAATPAIAAPMASASGRAATADVRGRQDRADDADAPGVTIADLTGSDDRAIRAPLIQAATTAVPSAARRPMGVTQAHTLASPAIQQLKMSVGVLAESRPLAATIPARVPKADAKAATAQAAGMGSKSSAAPAPAAAPTRATDAVVAPASTRSPAQTMSEPARPIVAEHMRVAMIPAAESAPISAPTRTADAMPSAGTGQSSPPAPPGAASVRPDRSTTPVMVSPEPAIARRDAPIEPQRMGAAPAPVESPPAQLAPPAPTAMASWLERGANRGGDAPSRPHRVDASTETGAVPASLMVASPQAVTPLGAAAHSALDLRRDAWMDSMVDRIATLRDAADATRTPDVAETRIRLSPDALGHVDVAIRRDGDRIHVHFAAHNAEARALIQDATPRLAELADARGVRLGQTSVGSGGTGADPQGRQPAPRPAAAPARASANPTASGDRPDDTRIA